MKVKTAGFTLLELLVVIAIIGVLSSVVFGSLSDAKDKSKEVAMLKQIREFNKSIFMYEMDTYTKFNCEAAVCNDMLLTNPGVDGWKGPYYTGFIHPWGGQIEIGKHSIDGVTSPETLIHLTNDRPGFGYSDNRAKIPMESLLKIDKDLDDGNLNTGSIRVYPAGTRNYQNELLIRPNN